MIRVKVCGIKDVDFIQQAQLLPIHAFGFMFYEQSKRYISIEQAKLCVKETSPFIQTVGVFVNPSKEYVDAVLSRVSLNLLQFHGEESELFCRQFARPYIKAISVKHDADLNAIASSYQSAVGLLLDHGTVSQQGGTGQQFDWQLIPKRLKKPLIIAGGINVQNVQQLIKSHQISAIDISSGVEDQDGHKCITILKQFIQAIKN